ncbi:MAG: hypothetical protein ACJ79V_03475, partial [Myxococcales bacterium]
PRLRRRALFIEDLMSGSVRIAAAALYLGPLAIGSLAACGASDPPRTLEVWAHAGVDEAGSLSPVPVRGDR